MANFRWDIALAVFGVLVPTMGFLYEFILVGRKRLGYRVQMDTTASAEVRPEYARALQLLQEESGSRLVDPSFVLLRIENNGATQIDHNDYANIPQVKYGIRVSFPGRKVAGMVVTELSAPHLADSFGKDSGLRVQDGVIELPKVPLNRSAHYKVLAALERVDKNGTGEKFKPPQIVGGIKGGVGRGDDRGVIQETKAHTGTSRQAILLISFLVLIILGQLVFSVTSNDAAPLECATGNLALTGSTAFRPVLQEAANSYKHTCPGASFTIDTQGSADGLRKLDQVGKANSSASPNVLAFSDGAKSDGFPQLLPRPIAFSLFTLVINKQAGVQDLSLDQIRQLYAGRITNWTGVGGNNLPVRLVSRDPDSGTRKTLQQQILGGAREPGSTSDDCEEVAPGAPPGVIRCERKTTDEVTGTVARIPGAIGYTNVGDASGREDLLFVRIGGHQATLEEADRGAYPFWETEYAYTYGEPPADSLAASFLRYLTDEVGKDIVRSHGSRPCSELQNPVLCRPL